MGAVEIRRGSRETATRLPSTVALSSLPMVLMLSVLVLGPSPRRCPCSFSTFVDSRSKTMVIAGGIGAASDSSQYTFAAFKGAECFLERLIELQLRRTSLLLFLSEAHDVAGCDRG